MEPETCDSVIPEATARLEVRAPRRVKALVERAAKLQGRSVSDFVATAAQEAAQKTIEDEALLRISLEDQRQIAKALLSPPKPNAALRSALKLNREMIDPE